ncbi:TPA: hypothetical protein ACKPR3_001846, partial [Streptococcus pyogenes]
TLGFGLAVNMSVGTVLSNLDIDLALVRNVTACNLWVIETAGIEPAYPVVVSTRCTAIRLQNNKFDCS